MKTRTKLKQGFALLSAEERKVLSSKGGKALSKNTLHMSMIGAKGAAVRAEKKRQKIAEDNQNRNPNTPS
jgi:hypothetical protein